MGMISKLDSTGQVTLNTGCTLDEVGFDTTSLVGWWKLDGLNDLSGNGRTLTNNGAVAQTTNRFGESNKAYNFANDNTDWLQSSALSDVTNITLSCWVKITASTTNSQCIMTFANSTGLRYALVVDSTGLVPYIWYVNTTVYGAGALTDRFTFGTWCHIVLTCNNAGGILYFNGVASTLDTPFAFTNATTYLSTLVIGKGNTVASIPLNGSIGDAKMFSRVLTAAEIKLLYLHERGNYYNTTTKAGNLTFDEVGFDQTSLVGWWKLDGLNDLSGNGRTLTAYNTPTATTNRFGSSGSAYNFASASSEYMLSSCSFDLITNWTISVWCKNTGNTTETMLSHCGSNANYRVAVTKVTGVLRVIVNDGAIKYSYQSSTNIATNAWLHIVIINTAGVITAYVNGYTVSFSAPTSGLSAADTGLNTLSVGRNNLNASLEYYNGDLSDIKILTRALSSVEAKKLYLHERGNFGCEASTTVPPKAKALKFIET